MAAMSLSSERSSLPCQWPFLAFRTITCTRISASSPATNAAIDVHQAVIYLDTSACIPVSVHLPAMSAIIDARIAEISLYTSVRIPESARLHATNANFDALKAAV